MLYHPAVITTLFLFAGVLLPQAYGFAIVGPRPRMDESRALVVPTTTRSSSTICHATRFKGMKIPSFQTKKNDAPETPQEPGTSQKSLGNFKNVLNRVNQSVSQIATRGTKQEEVTPPKPKGPVERLASKFQRGASVQSAPDTPTVQSSAAANDAAPAFLKRMKTVLASTSSTAETTVIDNKKGATQKPAGKPMEQVQTQVEALQVDLQQTVQERTERVMGKWNDLQKVISESTAEIKTTVEDTVKTTQQVVKEVKAIPQRVQETKASDAAEKTAQEVVNKATSLKKSPSSVKLWKDFSTDAVSKTGNFMQWAAKEAAEVASQAVAVSLEVATELTAAEDDTSTDVAVMERTATATTSDVNEEEVVEALMAAEAELKALNAPTMEESTAVSSMEATAEKNAEDTKFTLEVEEALLAAEAALDDLNDSAASTVTPVVEKEETTSEVEETPLATKAAVDDLNDSAASLK